MKKQPAEGSFLAPRVHLVFFLLFPDIPNSFFFSACGGPSVFLDFPSVGGSFLPSKCSWEAYTHPLMCHFSISVKRG